MILLCNKCKQARSRGPGRTQQRGYRFARLGCHLIALRSPHLSQQPVRAKQPQHPPHFRRSLPATQPPAHVLAQRFAHVSVPYAVQVVLRVVEHSQRFHLPRFKQAQASRAFAPPSHRFAQRREHRCERFVAVHLRERFEVPSACRSADLLAPGHVGDAASQLPPAFLAAFVAFGTAVDLEGGGVVDGHFASQHAAFVVEFDRVVAGPVFDAHSFLPPEAVGLHFGFAGGFAAQKAQDLLAAESCHASEHESGIDFLEGFAVFEHDVGGVLAFGGGVIVVNGDCLAQALVHGVVLPDERLKGRLEVGEHLRVHERLGAGQVGDGGEAVVGAFVGDALGVELAREPFAAVDAEVNEEWEPGLEAHVHQAEDGMHEVEVEVGAFAPVEPEVEFFVGAAAADEPGAARLDATEHGEEALAHRVLVEDLGGEALLVQGARAQVMDLAARGLSGERGGVADALGDGAQVGFEVLVEDAGAHEVVVHGLLAIEGAQGALEAHAVQAADNARDMGVMFVQEGKGATVGFLVGVFVHKLTLARAGRWRRFLVERRGCGAGRWFVLGFGIWDLEFFWNLGFWNLEFSAPQTFLFGCGCAALSSPW